MYFQIFLLRLYISGNCNYHTGPYTRMTLISQINMVNFGLDFYKI